MELLAHFLIAGGAGLGLAVILFQSPFLRHTIWLFSKLGRKKGTPLWTIVDFDTYLVYCNSMPANFLLKVTSCSACQSVHTGTVATALLLIIYPVDLVLLGFLWLSFIGAFFSVFGLWKLLHK